MQAPRPRWPRGPAEWGAGGRQLQEKLLLCADWPQPAAAAACRKQLAENNGQGWVLLHPPGNTTPRAACPARTRPAASRTPEISPRPGGLKAPTSTLNPITRENKPVPPPRASVSRQQPTPRSVRGSSRLSAAATRRRRRPTSPRWTTRVPRDEIRCEKSTLAVNNRSCLPVREAALHRAPPSWTPHSPSHRCHPPLSGCMRTNPTS